jgi:nucleoid-associated protein YgaU
MPPPPPPAPPRTSSQPKPPANPAASNSSHGAGHQSQSSRSGGKAYIELCKITTAHDVTEVSGKGNQITFQFNPKEFTITKSANWNSTVTHTQAQAQYLGPNPATMSLEMFLDTSDTGKDVSLQVKALMEACNPTPDSTSGNRPLPPGVRFGWDKVYFEGYLESVAVHYLLFLRNGRPIRALCTLTIKEVPKVQRGQNPTSGGTSNQGSHTVVDGDSLPSIAYKEYGDAAHWRAIALTNGIDDPLRMQPGTRLLIPHPEEAAVVSQAPEVAPAVLSARP